VASRGLAGRHQLAARSLGERLGTDSAEHVVRDAQMLARVDAPFSQRSHAQFLGAPASLCGAIEAAAANLRRKFAALGDAVNGESSADILARHGLDELSADGETIPHPKQASVAPSPARAPTPKSRPGSCGDRAWSLPL
jgi:hypothetical protein